MRQLCETYVRRYAAFDRSEQLALLTALLDALHEDDVELFEAAIQRYRKGHELRPWQVTLLLAVKKELTSGGADAADIDLL